MIECWDGKHLDSAIVSISINDVPSWFMNQIEIDYYTGLSKWDNFRYQVAGSDLFLWAI
jgi:hypothetical protein